MDLKKNKINKTRKKHVNLFSFLSNQKYVFTYHLQLKLVRKSIDLEVKLKYNGITLM